MPTIKPPRMPRGLAINNPLNVFWSDRNKWIGQDPERRDGKIEAFKTPEAGIRAAAKVLLKYKDRHLDTLAEIIDEWAPPHKKSGDDINHTEAYITYVSNRLDIDRHREIEVDDVMLALPLIRAMGRFEQGVEIPYSDKVILDGLRAAGISGVPSVVAGKTPEAQGAKTIAAAGSGQLAIEASYDFLTEFEPLKAALMELAPAMTVAKYALMALTMVGVGMVLWGVFNRIRKGFA